MEIEFAAMDFSQKCKIQPAKNPPNENLDTFPVFKPEKKMINRILAYILDSFVCLPVRVIADRTQVIAVHNVSCRWRCTISSRLEAWEAIQLQTL